MSMSINCSNEYGSFSMVLDGEVRHVREFTSSEVDNHYKLTMEQLEQMEMIRDPKLRIQESISIEDKNGFVIFHVSDREAVLAKVTNLEYCGKKSARDQIEEDNNADKMTLQVCGAYWPGKHVPPA